MVSSTRRQATCGRWRCRPPARAEDPAFPGSVDTLSGRGPMRLARRLEHIEPFYVMAFAKKAREIAASPACDPAHGGERMLYLNIGEPDFTAPAPVVEAAEAALRA